MRHTQKIGYIFSLEHVEIMTVHACEVAANKCWAKFQDGVSITLSKSKICNLNWPKIKWLAFHSGQKANNRSWFNKILIFCIFFLFLASLRVWLTLYTGVFSDQKEELQVFELESI